MFLYQRPNSSRWWIRYWRDGKPISKSTGTSDRSIAERALAEIRAIVAGKIAQDRIRDLLTAAARQPLQEMATTVISIDAIWTAYTDTQHARDLAARSIGSKRQHVNAFCRWLQHHYPEIRDANTISSRIAAEYIDTMADASPITANNHLSTLRSVWSSLRIKLGLHDNPWTDVQRAGIARHVHSKSAFTAAQIQAIYTAAVTKGGWWPAAIALGYHCGLRWGDVCTLTWDEIDAAGHRLNLADNKTMRYGRGALSLDLPQVAIDAIHATTTNNTPGYVWPDKAAAHRNNSGYLAQQLRDIFTAAGITCWDPAGPGERRRRAVQRYGFHSLRHTYVSLLRDAGLSRGDIAALVGHGSPITTARYDHSQAATRKAAGLIPPINTPVAPA